MLLVFIGKTSAQTTMDYSNPYFEFDNIADLTEFSSSLLTEVDLAKFQYKELVSDSGKKRWHVDVPFYVNQTITDDNDFIFLMYYGPTWSILDSNKQPLVKDFYQIKDDDGSYIGVQQMNGNLTNPVSKPGIYYIRLIVDEKPKAKKAVYLYLARIDEVK